MSVDPIVQEFDAGLSPGERDLVDRAREFGRLVVAPQAAKWERERRHPIETLRATCAAGLATIELPIESGGLGFSFSAKMRVAEELARHDFGFAFALVNHHNALVRVARSAPLRERLLPRMLRGEAIGCSAYTEPEYGSDLGHLSTTARQVAGGWQLDGVKSWTTNAATADLFLTLAQTDPGAGSRGIALLLVESDRAGFHRAEAFELQGAHSIGAGGFRLAGYLAPPEALLAAPGNAFRDALSGINAARCYVAAMCAGMLDEAIDLAVRYTSHRNAFGQPLFEFQGLRWKLVDAANELAAMRLLAYRAARLIDQGQDATEAAAAAKKFAGDRTVAQLSGCVQALGANGLRTGAPLMRHLVAAKTACFTDGTTEMMNERLGKLLLQRRGGDSDSVTVP